MKCLRKYKWVKLPRVHLPSGKGLMGYWAKLASRAAFRKGNAVYCGYVNPVTPGMWSGGVVGLKSILGVKRRVQALWIMNQLQDLGYITYSHDLKTKHLTYQINDWVLKCSGAACMDGAVYVTEGYGFLCMPRNITERLVGKRTFEEADAWLDLWCHTTYGDYGNAFSFLGPAIQYGKYGSVLTLDNLGKRWGWEKTKVWRFFKKHEDTYVLFRLPGAYGCVIFNRIYPAASEIPMPEHEDVIKVLNDIRKAGKKISVRGSDSERLNCMIAWRSRIVVTAYEKEFEEDANTGVALSNPLIRAYFCGEDISDIIPARVPVAEKRPFIYELRSVDGSFSVSLDQVVTVIGREAQLKEYLSSKVYVSRQHAKLTVVAEKVFIENLSQTNKTFLNNEEISSETPTAVNNGDEIGLGGKVINGTRQENAAYFVFQVKA